ncbi:MAG: DNA repair protein RecO [Patescibacteria group bacterium]
MWSTIKTEALVISSEPWKEADRRYRALTPAHGKLEFVGRGAMKGKAKLAAHLEPFAVVKLEIIKGRSSTTVIGVERLEAFKTLATVIESRLLALAAVALIDKTVRPDLEDQFLYSEALELLRFLDTAPAFAPTRNTLVLGGFLLRLLRHLGYDVELGTCLACKDDIRPLAFRWHEGRGGLVCTNCVLEQPQEWFAARALDEEIVTLLRFARDARYLDLLKPSLRADHVGMFATCVHDLLRFHVPGYVDETPFWYTTTVT